MIGPGAKDAAVHLGSSLKDADWNIRFVAAKALEKIGPGAKDAVPDLIAALPNHDDHVYDQW